NFLQGLFSASELRDHRRAVAGGEREHQDAVGSGGDVLPSEIAWLDVPDPYRGRGSGAAGVIQARRLSCLGSAGLDLEEGTVEVIPVEVGVDTDLEGVPTSAT